MSEGPRLFVSYSHDDSHLIDRLRVLPILEDLGFEPWLDRRGGLTAGAHIDDAITAALQSSSGMVALWSPAYVRQGAYTEAEYCQARFTLGIPTAVILIERVAPTDLSSAMSRLLVPNHTLQNCDPEDALAFIAKELLDAGIRLPRGAPPQGNKGIDLAGSTITPTYTELSQLDQHGLRLRMERLQRILSANSSSPYHCINAALVALQSEDHAAASNFAQRALQSHPDDGEINYFAALVAASIKPLVRGPRERIAAIWDLAERAKRKGYGRGLPSLLQAALCLDYHACNGSRPPAPADQLIASAELTPDDRGELMRLIQSLQKSAPVFTQQIGRL